MRQSNSSCPHPESLLSSVFIYLSAEHLLSSVVSYPHGSLFPLTSLAPVYMANNTDIWRKRFIDGGWIPPSREVLNEWLTRRKAPTGDKIPYLEPAVQALKHLIETDPEVYMGFYEMLELNPSGGPVGPNRAVNFW